MCAASRNEQSQRSRRYPTCPRSADYSRSCFPLASPPINRRRRVRGRSRPQRRRCPHARGRRMGHDARRQAFLVRHRPSNAIDFARTASTVCDVAPCVRDTCPPMRCLDRIAARSSDRNAKRARESTRRTNAMRRARWASLRLPRSTRPRAARHVALAAHVRTRDPADVTGADCSILATIQFATSPFIAAAHASKVQPVAHRFAARASNRQESHHETQQSSRLRRHRARRRRAGIRGWRDRPRGRLRRCVGARPRRPHARGSPRGTRTGATRRHARRAAQIDVVRAARRRARRAAPIPPGPRHEPARRRGPVNATRRAPEPMRGASSCLQPLPSSA
ncbi:hypothetical protein BMAA1470 [Burkholderia mallei ATCC 23344]|uniref:Uncharacterized protein n=1 Tax=Burkholderia mallei (strain ATCC 23344) TaxID=243160 RepID=A0A0H2WD59_BURMA|nr:hypothetical protein BMAA1470 [Burkholderia mallei ATCC 23344]